MLRFTATAALLLALIGVGSASAAVTTTTEVSSEGVSLYVLGDGADDRITIGCGGDGNVKVVEVDPGFDFDPGPSPVACEDITAISVDGGAGNDRIYLGPIQPAAFPNLCGPCPDGTYSVVAECVAGDGNDKIVSGDLGELIGGCFGQRSMPGDDQVRANGGDDAVAAGSGEDRVKGGDGADQLFGGPDDDTVIGGHEDDVIAGKQGRDALSGGAGEDSCSGGPGPDTATGCEFTRGVSRAVSLGFAPRSVTD